MQRWIIAASLILVAVYFARPRPNVRQEEPEIFFKPVETRKPTLKPVAKVTKPEFVAPVTAPPPVSKQTTVRAVSKDDNSARVYNFVLEDKVAVIQGDIVVGQIVGGDGKNEGKVLLPKMNMWKRNEIAVAYDPSISRPERIQKALAMFESTAVKFVPYDGQEDTLVFIEGTGHCKSYVGRTTGKQPIWIAPECEAPEIAHELLHALGFVHEQNRTDRDRYVEVLEQNIDEKFKYNFEKLPEDFMAVSGLTDFDYDSIMIYPENAFSKTQAPTIQSKTANKISPSQTLSEKDIERINRVYGRL